MPTNRLSPGTDDCAGSWLQDPAHLAYLRADAARQLAFFRPSLRRDGGFDVLGLDGTRLPRGPQELHTTTRLIHAYALGRTLGDAGAEAMVDAGMAFLWAQHRDADQGGYVWSVHNGSVADGVKLAYGHVFVLLAGCSARLAGHPDADRLIADIAGVIERHYWDEAHGLLRDEFTRDWLPFSTYRGMNANMHGVEAMLAAHEATGQDKWLNRAGRILDFFVGQMAPAHGWRIPEHYTDMWQVDPGYSGNPMFRPAGTTPGHSFELARLTLQHWDLCGRPESGAPARARHLVDTALQAWLPEGGLAYTLDLHGNVALRDRYWWPVTEAIGALSALMKAAPQPGDEVWYRRLWRFADAHFIDHARGGWYPEIDVAGAPTARQFIGKPDLYHALQADLLPLVPTLSRLLPSLNAC